MKIAFVHQPIFFVPVNKSISVPLLVHEIASRLAKSHEVIVYAAANGSHKKVVDDDGIHYQGVPVSVDKFLLKVLKGWRKLTGFRNPKQPPFGSNTYYSRYIWEVANDLKKQQCDIVHILNLSQAIPVIRALNPNIKIVLRMGMDWLAQLDKKMVEQRLKDVDLIIGCSEYITDRIRKRFPQFADRCQTVHNGTDVDRFLSQNNSDEMPSNSPKQLLFVGRVSPEKGVHVLIDAFQKVVKEYPQVQLQIVGKATMLPLSELVAMSDHPNVQELASFYPGDYLSNLQNRMSPDVASQVVFTGNVSHAKLDDYFQKADIFIHPSIFDDPFPNAVLEAIASGLPIVATCAGGVVESVADGKTGLLVERSDADALAEAILRLLTDDELRTSMGQAARQRALEMFSWERTVADLLSHYTHLLEGEKTLQTS